MVHQVSSGWIIPLHTGCNRLYVSLDMLAAAMRPAGGHSAHQHLVIDSRHSLTAAAMRWSLQHLQEVRSKPMIMRMIVWLAAQHQMLCVRHSAALSATYADKPLQDADTTTAQAPPILASSPDTHNGSKFLVLQQTKLHSKPHERKPVHEWFCLLLQAGKHKALHSRLTARNNPPNSTQ